MKVNLVDSPKHPNGFKIQFPYHPDAVKYIKNVMGTEWDKKENSWVCEGPEVLLDFERFKIEIGHLSPRARLIAEDFRQQIWNTIDCRILAVGDDKFAYQKQGAEFLSMMPHAILGDDRGTGKSKQSLDAAAMIKAQNILVLCTPKTLVYNWMQEVAHWHPEYTAGIVPDEKKSRKKKDGTPVMGKEEFWANPPQIVITNYDKLRMSDWPLEREWDVVICDELPKAAKNSTTIAFHKLKKIYEHSVCFWALTGSPMEKNLTELYNIFSLMRPSVLGNYMRFKSQHMSTDWRSGETLVHQLNLLRDRIGPFILRRTKSEVNKFLPPRVPEVRFVEMTPEEQKTYYTMTDHFDPMTWRKESSGEHPLTQLMHMRQFCCSPDMVEKTKELGRGSKFETLKEIIEEWEGQVVVFCFFTEATRRLHQWLRVPERAYIDGSVPAVDRVPRINDFNAGKLGKVFISSDAGSTGVNITGANLIIHYDQLMNNEAMNQRVDRLHRIGQENTVTFMHLMYLDSVDYGIYLTNAQEAALFHEVIDGAEEALLKKLDAPRWKKLVEGRI